MCIGYIPIIVKNIEFYSIVHLKFLTFDFHVILFLCLLHNVKHHSKSKYW